MSVSFDRACPFTVCFGMKGDEEENEDHENGNAWRVIGRRKDPPPRISSI
jgi:hypothetical protein